MESYYNRHQTSNKRVKESMRNFTKRMAEKEEGIIEITKGKFLVRVRRPNDHRIVTVGFKDTLAKAKRMFKAYKEGKKTLPSWNKKNI